MNNPTTFIMFIKIHMFVQYYIHYLIFHWTKLLFGIQI